jgi:hypothetical protein
VQQRLHLILLRYVARLRCWTCPNFLRNAIRGLAQAPFMEVADQQARTFLGRAQSDGEANASTGGGGDQNGFAVQQAARHGILGWVSSH